MELIALNSFHDILSFLTPNQLIRARKVCRFWKQVIDGRDNHFEKLVLSDDPSESIYDIRHYTVSHHYEGALSMPTPFNNKIKKLVLSCAPTVAKIFLKTNFSFLLNVKEIELETRNDIVNGERVILWIVQNYGSKMTNLRLTLSVPPTIEFANNFHYHLSRDCKIWLRLNSRAFNCSAFDNLRQDARLQGLVDVYHNSITKRTQLTSFIKFPLKEISMVNLYFGCDDFLRTMAEEQLNFHLQTITSLFVRCEAHSYKECGLNQRMSKFIESIPNLEKLEFKWVSDIKDTHAPVDLGVAAQKITSLTLDFPLDADVTYTCKFTAKQFPKLKMFVLNTIRLDIPSLFTLLESMPVLERLEIQSSDSIKDKSTLHELCSRTSAHYIDIRHTSPEIHISLGGGVFHVTNGKGRVAIYDSYQKKYGYTTLVRRCTINQEIQKTKSKRRRIR